MTDIRTLKIVETRTGIMATRLKSLAQRSGGCRQKLPDARVNLPVPSVHRGGRGRRASLPKMRMQGTPFSVQAVLFQQMQRTPHGSLTRVGTESYQRLAYQRAYSPRSASRVVSPESHLKRAGPRVRLNLAPLLVFVVTTVKFFYLSKVPLTHMCTLILAYWPVRQRSGSVIIKSKDTHGAGIGSHRFAS